MAEIKYEIVERIAVLGERPRGWERQLNLISFSRTRIHGSVNRSNSISFILLLLPIFQTILAVIAKLHVRKMGGQVFIQQQDQLSVQQR